MQNKTVSEFIKYDDIKYPVQAKESKHSTVPLHWHSYYEVELFISGAATHLVNGNIYDFRTGDISVMNPTDFHSYIPAGDSFSVKKFIYMDNNLSTEISRLLLSDKIPNVIRLTSGQDEFLQLFDLLITVCSDRSKLGCMLAKNLAEQFFIKLAMYAEHMKFPIDSAKYDKTERLSEILRYITNHFNESLTLSDVAGQINMSTNYLSHYFSSELGTTFSNYLKMKRIQYAISLLSMGKYSIEDVAYSSGLPSLTFFNRTFKAQYGISPLEYKKSYCKQILQI